MATVKKSTTKKAAPKKAAVKTKASPAESKAASAPEKLGTLETSLTDADRQFIAETAAQAAAAAVQAMMSNKADDPPSPSQVRAEALEHSPGGKHVEGQALETIAPMPEEAAGWNEEQIAAFNKREADKMRARKRVQAENRKDLEKMGTADRMRAMMRPRDPNVIRTAVPPDWDGDEDNLVLVTCKRRIGINDAGDMSDIDENIRMPRDNAKALQKSGAVEVAL